MQELVIVDLQDEQAKKKRQEERDLQRFQQLLQIKINFLNELNAGGWESKQPEPQYYLEQGGNQPIMNLSQMQATSLTKESDLWNDNRQEVKSPLIQKTPYSCIGELVMTFNVEGQDKMFYGTAFLVSDGIALTCAHNVHNRTYGKAKRMTLFLGLKEQKGARYKILNFTYPKNFQGQYNSENDYAILFLQRSTSKKFGNLGLRLENPINQVLNIRVIGFPQKFKGEQLKQKKKMVMSSGNAQIKENNEIIYHKETHTSTGQSGSPILIKENNKEFCIGIHLGENTQGNKFGLLLNQRIHEHYQLFIQRDVQMNFTALSQEKWELIKKYKKQKAVEMLLRNCFYKNSKENMFFAYQEEKQKKIIGSLRQFSHLKLLDMAQNELRTFDCSALHPDVIESLDLSINRLSCKHLVQFNKFKWVKLHSLDLYHNNINSQLTLNGSSFPVLQFLNLSNCIELDWKVLRMLGTNGFNSLVELSLDNNELFIGKPQQIDFKYCQFRNLQVLYLSSTFQNCKNVIPKLDQISMPQLKQLYLANNRIGRQQLIELQATKFIKNLCLLDLSRNPLDVKELIKLQMPRLYSLFLNEKQSFEDDGDKKNLHIDDQCMKFLLRNGPFLKELGNLQLRTIDKNIEYSSISVQCLQSIILNCPRLSHLAVNHNININASTAKDIQNKYSKLRPQLQIFPQQCNFDF